jgi:peptidoglycan/LPS O-acetylase OafA/YrhL
MNQPTRDRQFFGGLESLRGVAALLVVFYHLPPWYLPLFELPLVRHGYLMVNLFFVLSGFVLFHSYSDKLGTSVSIRDFVLLRLGRLYPVHLLFLLPFLVIVIAKWLGHVRASGTLAASIPALGHIGAAAASQALLLHGFGAGTGEPSFNFPSWTISCEFYTYLVFALVVLVTGIRSLWAACAVIAIAGMTLPPLIGLPLAGGVRMLSCVGGFFLGGLANMLFQKLHGKDMPAPFPSALAVLAIVLLLLPWNRQQPIPAWLEQLSYPLSALFIIAVLMAPASAAGRLLLWAPLRWLGAISYSLYMCHAIVQWAVRQTAEHLPSSGTHTVDGITAPALGLGTTLVLTAAATALTLGLAQLSYRFVETPGRQIVRSWLNRPA